MNPRASEAYWRRAAKEQRAALASVQGAWRRVTDDFDASWVGVQGSVVAAVSQAQDVAVQAAGEYVPEVLAETGQRVRPLEYEPRGGAWAGVAGDGRPVASLAGGAVVRAKQGVSSGLSSFQARQAAGVWLVAAMGTVITDTMRSAEQVHMKSRRVGGYVRMLSGTNPCGRCVILAGVTYSSSTAFERHPQCRCVHIPASESVATDLRVDPHGWLDSLDDDDLAKALGSRANAEAFKDGADPSQLVNAYRRKGYVQKAQVYGRDVKFTVEGTTRRGLGGKAMRRAGAGSDFSRGAGPRMMPSSIYEIAGNRDEEQRLLRRFGWIL